MSENGAVAVQGTPGGQVRIAVVGLGYWGPNLVRNLRELPEADVCLLCDIRRDAVAELMLRYPGVSGTTRFERVLDDASIEAVAIATPVATHYELAAAALEAGKHVFVEKPLASSSAEALDLRQLAQANERVLMPGHTFLYSAPVRMIRSLIEAGELGDIHFISSSRVNLGLHQADASVLWDLAPHDFSILHYLLGVSPTHVSALCRDCVGSGTPDVAFINLEYGSGTIAHVELSWLAPSKLRRTTIVGSQRMVLYDDTSREPVRIFDSGVLISDPETFGEYQMSYRTGDIVSPRVDAAEPIFLELADFIHAIREDVEPRSNAELGLDVVRMIEAVDASIAGPVARVALPDLNGFRGRRT